MKAEPGTHHGEKGQTLVWVAISALVLLGLVGLAIDGGNLYGERRHMQNAADAAALEAARAKCFDNLSSEDAATQGAAFAASAYPRATTVDVQARALNDWEFDATASESVPLTFMRLFGFDPVPVPATASAACGATEQACGLFPLALSQAIWNGVADKCDQKFFVWTSDKDKENGNDNDVPPVCGPDCDCTKVYVKNKLEPSAIAIADVGRAWIDFTSSIDPELYPATCGGNNGCGAAELKCWIQNDSPVLVLKNTCVSGDSGNKLGVRNEVNDRVGDYVSIPIFDKTCTASGSGSCTGGFNIVGFGCVEVQEWKNQKVELYKPGTEPKQANLCFSGQMMPVKVACNKCATDCGFTSGGGDPGSKVKAVSLIK